MNELLRENGQQVNQHLTTPDYEHAFDISEGKQSWFVALLSFLRQRTIAELGLVGAVVSLTIIAWQVARNADKLTAWSFSAVALVVLLVTTIGLISLLKGMKNGTTGKADPDEPAQPGDVGGNKEEAGKAPAQDQRG